MRGRPTTSCLLLCLLVPALSSCAPEEDDDLGQQAFSPCEFEDRAQIYEPDMVLPGEEGLTSITLLSVTPAPPDVGDSEWLVEIADLEGDPLDGCTVTATLWMPDHGHGAPEGQTVPKEEPGQYLLTGISFVMAGYWEITVAADCPDLDMDQAVFGFCLDG